MKSADTLRAAQEVARVFEDLQIPYLVGGSLASSAYGIPRTTQDADLVADLQFRHVQPLTSALSSTFYIDPERIGDAIRRRASFNIIHLSLKAKVDIFVMKDDLLARQQMIRRQSFTFPEETILYVASPEDTVLQKLHWYKIGGSRSDRQWEDVLGVLKVQRRTLDIPYLRRWADHLEVEDLVERVLEESGILQ